MGKNMKHAMAFARKYPGWHTFAHEVPTVRAIQRLAKRGLVAVNAFRQFKAIA